MTRRSLPVAEQFPLAVGPDGPIPPGPWSHSLYPLEPQNRPNVQDDVLAVRFALCRKSLFAYFKIVTTVNKLIFYDQKRRDGGIRTGVELNDERILEQFEPGDLPQDSALLWFVDVRCSGERLPSQPEAVRQWLLERSDEIRAELSQLSNDLIAGIDSEWPLKKELPPADGVHMAIYCSAIRRLSGRDISSILSDLATRWPSLVQSLGAYEQLIPFNA